MESKLPGKSYIEKMAEIFMDEGDIETARILQKQVAVHQSREMTEEEAELYETNKSNVRKAIGYGDFQRAIEFQSVALGLAQRAFGNEHMETLKEMCALGDCHYRNGEYKKAQDLYYRSLRISTTKFGALHPFSNRVKKNISKCVDAVRRKNGLNNLEKHINSVFRMSQPTIPFENLVRIDRLESIGQKLISRGQSERALRVYKAWISLCLGNANPDDEKAIESRAKYADVLLACGNLAEAETIYKSVVQVRNQQNLAGEKSSELKVAINDWAKCLSAMGHLHSARETHKLSERIFKC